MSSENETHAVTCVYMESGELVEWATRVTLPAGSPMSDYSDVAWDRVHSRCPGAEFVDER